MSVYDCHNRPAFKTVRPIQDGYYLDGVTRTPRLVPDHFRMARDCQYTLTGLGQADPKCTGCTHRKEQEG